MSPQTVTCFITLPPQCRGSCAYNMNTSSYLNNTLQSITISATGSKRALSPQWCCLVISYYCPCANENILPPYLPPKDLTAVWEHSRRAYKCTTGHSLQCSPGVSHAAVYLFLRQSPSLLAATQELDRRNELEVSPKQPPLLRDRRFSPTLDSFLLLQHYSYSPNRHRNCRGLKLQYS